MNKLSIVTDTAASLPTGLAEELGIHLVPMSIVLGDKTFREGVDMDSGSLYDLLRQGEMPTTSQPAPGDFLEVFRPLVDAGQRVMAVLVTSKASGTFQSARIAADMLPAGAVTVFDSASFGMGTGLLTIAATEAANAGQSAEEIRQLLERLRTAHRIYLAVPTLKYLQKSGRVNMTQALMGKLLNIKPILSAEDGLINVVEKARSWQGALSRILAMAKELVGDQPVVVAVQHAGDLQAAEDFLAKVQAELVVKKCYISELSASLAMHGGPGMLGLAVYPLDSLQN